MMKFTLEELNTDKYRSEHEPIVDIECYEILENIRYDIILDEIKNNIADHNF